MSVLRKNDVLYILKKNWSIFKQFQTNNEKKGLERMETRWNENFVWLLVVILTLNETYTKSSHSKDSKLMVGNPSNNRILQNEIMSVAFLDCTREIEVKFYLEASLSGPVVTRPERMRKLLCLEPRCLPIFDSFCNLAYFDALSLNDFFCRFDSDFLCS